MQIPFNGLFNGALIALPAMGVRWRLFAVGGIIHDGHCSHKETALGNNMGPEAELG